MAHNVTSNPSVAHNVTSNPSVAHTVTSNPSVAHNVTSKPSVAHTVTSNPCVAHTVTSNPCVVCDSGLDPSSRRLLWNVIREAKKTAAVVMTTHSMEEAEALCDRIGIFVGGKLSCIGSPQVGSTAKMHMMGLHGMSSTGSIVQPRPS